MSLCISIFCTLFLCSLKIPFIGMNLFLVAHFAHHRNNCKNASILRCLKSVNALTDIPEHLKTPSLGPTVVLFILKNTAFNIKATNFADVTQGTESRGSISYLDFFILLFSKPWTSSFIISLNKPDLWWTKTFLQGKPSRC